MRWCLLRDTTCTVKLNHGPTDRQSCAIAAIVFAWWSLSLVSAKLEIERVHASASIVCCHHLSLFFPLLMVLIHSLWYTSHLYFTLLLELSFGVRPQVELSLDKLLFVAFAGTLISTQDELIWNSLSRSPQRGIIGEHGWTWQNWLLPFLYTSLFVLVTPLGRGHSTPSGGQCADSPGISRAWNRMA